MRRPSRPYIDRGDPGTFRYQGGQLLTVVEPPRVRVQIMTLQQVRRHNMLEPILQPTERVLLRWSESVGEGLPDPDADRRETHYDPLPPDVQKQVEAVVDVSPWKTLTIRWYRSAMDKHELAEQLRVSRAQLYADWKCSLWYYNGRFQAERIYG